MKFLVHYKALKFGQVGGVQNLQQNHGRADVIYGWHPTSSWWGTRSTTTSTTGTSCTSASSTRTASRSTDHDGIRAFWKGRHCVFLLLWILYHINLFFKWILQLSGDPDFSRTGRTEEVCLHLVMLLQFVYCHCLIKRYHWYAAITQFVGSCGDRLDH